MCTRFNIDVIKSQLDLIRQARHSTKIDVNFSLFLPPFLRFVEEYFLSSSKTFSRFSLVVIQLNTTHQNKRVNRPIVSVFFSLLLHRHHYSFLFYARLNIIRYLLKRETKKKKEKKGKIFSFVLSLSLYAYRFTRRPRQLNEMIERLLAPSPPAQLVELVTEPPEVNQIHSSLIEHCILLLFS